MTEVSAATRGRFWTSLFTSQGRTISDADKAKLQDDNADNDQVTINGKAINLSDGLSEGEMVDAGIENKGVVEILANGWKVAGDSGIEDDKSIKIDDLDRGLAAMQRYATAFGITDEQAFQLYSKEDMTFSRKDLERVENNRQEFARHVTAGYQGEEPPTGQAAVDYLKSTYHLEADDPRIKNLQAYIAAPEHQTASLEELAGQLYLMAYGSRLSTDDQTGVLKLTNAIPEDHKFEGDFAVESQDEFANLLEAWLDPEGHPVSSGTTGAAAETTAGAGGTEETAAATEEGETMNFGLYDNAAGALIDFVKAQPDEWLQVDGPNGAHYIVQYNTGRGEIEVKIWQANEEGEDGQYVVLQATGDEDTATVTVASILNEFYSNVDPSTIQSYFTALLEQYPDDSFDVPPGSMRISSETFPIVLGEIPIEGEAPAIPQAYRDAAEALNAYVASAPDRKILVLRANNLDPAGEYYTVTRSPSGQVVITYHEAGSAESTPLENMEVAAMLFDLYGGTNPDGEGMTGFFAGLSGNQELTAGPTISIDYRMIIAG